MVRIFLFLFVVLSSSTEAQKYTSARIFAHNDYVRDRPFHAAYALGVGYIEVDVFLKDGELMVAHHEDEIEDYRTLRVMYLSPLNEQVQANDGLVYPDPGRTLTLMIDLKTEGVATLNAVVAQLEAYEALISCRTLQFMISGSVPSPEKWKLYPSYISFDGRPGVRYTKDQLRRIDMISTNFRPHVKWDGHLPLSDDDRRKIMALKSDANKMGKPFRFWATPDFASAWKVLMDLDMDVIVTDRVEELARFLETEGR